MYVCMYWVYTCVWHLGFLISVFKEECMVKTKYNAVSLLLD